MKSISFSLKKTFGLLVLAFALTGQAQGFNDYVETVDLNISSFNLYPNQTVTVPLASDWFHIKEVIIEASSSSSCSSCDFTVWANGERKNIVYLSSSSYYDYTVTIGESAKSIQLVHRSGGPATIRSIRVVRVAREIPVSPVHVCHAHCHHNTVPAKPSHVCNSYCQHKGYYVKDANEVARLARQVESLMEQLREYANYEEWGTYLLPIKKKAADVYASAQYRGPLGGLSETVRIRVMALKVQISFATPYIEETYERGAAFELAQELKSIMYLLETVLI